MPPGVSVYPLVLLANKNATSFSSGTRGLASVAAATKNRAARANSSTKTSANASLLRNALTLCKAVLNPSGMPSTVSASNLAKAIRRSVMAKEFSMSEAALVSASKLTHAKPVPSGAQPRALALKLTSAFSKRNNA